jgi:hypothetical protein
MIFLDFHKQKVRDKELAAGTLKNFSTIFTAMIPSISQLVFWINVIFLFFIIFL